MYVSPVKALECSLLNRPHEILFHIFLRPFAASASPAPEKVPLRGNGGRVDDAGLALYGDSWTVSRHRFGSHFRAYSDVLRDARECGGIVTSVYLGFGNLGTNMMDGQTSLHPRRWVDPGLASPVSRIPVGNGSVHGDGASSLGLFDREEKEEGSGGSDRPAYHPINRLHGPGRQHDRFSPDSRKDPQSGAVASGGHSSCPVNFAGNGARHSTLFDPGHQAGDLSPAVDYVPEPPSADKTQGWSHPWQVAWGQFF